MDLDRQFNRIVTSHTRGPWANLGSRGSGATIHEGYVKCKLVHGLGYSVIVPDVLFFGIAGDRWIQPLAFGPNVLMKVDGQIRCQFSVDVSCGHRLIVDFTSRDFLASLVDGSELFRCTLKGPSDLSDYVTGTSTLSVGSAPYLRLYHHTSHRAKASIELSGEFWGSEWNIQGTHKKLTNVAYMYFTPVNKITHPDDLKLIAMASGGSIPFMVDDFQPPEVVGPGWEEKFRDKILVLPVYRASTLDRTATLEFEIESTLLSPHHILRHAPPRDAVWYEIATPFVQRIGIEPNSKLRFPTSRRISSADVKKTKQFGYIVVGDATTVLGLAAPYDEENTEQIFKIEHPGAGSNLLEFWFEHGNQDLYSPKNVELQALRPVDGDPK